MGASVSTVITSSSAITNGRTDFGLLIRVTRDNSGNWALFSSIDPSTITTGSGAIATDIPSSVNTAVSLGTGADNTHSIADNGYIGVVVLHSTGANAIISTEFDNFNFDIASNAPLPVELGMFTSQINGTKTFLTWETKTEKNSDVFLVERKLAESDVSGWNAVGSVKAAVLSNSPKQYSFSDENLQPGRYQYRLKMIDNDGSFEYSKVIEAEISTPKEFVLSQNYPNPFNPSTKIEYQLPFESSVLIEVFSITGEKISQILNADQPAGFHSIDFNSANVNRNLSSGIYLYKMTAVNKLDGSSFTATRKMSFLK